MKRPFVSGTCNGCQFWVCTLCSLMTLCGVHFVLCLKVEIMRLSLYTDSSVELDASLIAWMG